MSSHAIRLTFPRIGARADGAGRALTAAVATSRNPRPRRRPRPPLHAPPVEEPEEPLPSSPLDTQLPECRARRRAEAVHRGSRRDGEAPGRADRRHVQPHLLLRRPGRAAGRGVRVRAARRRAAEQALQAPHEEQGARLLRAAAARHAACGASRRTRRSRRGADHGETRARRAGGLHRSHPELRQADPRHRPRRARDLIGR